MLSGGVPAAPWVQQDHGSARLVLQGTHELARDPRLRCVPLASDGGRCHLQDTDFGREKTSHGRGETYQGPTLGNIGGVQVSRAPAVRGMAPLRADVSVAVKQWGFASGEPLSLAAAVRFCHFTHVAVYVWRPAYFFPLSGSPKGFVGPSLYSVNRV